jgi:Cu/Ag efflux protein CusF
MKTHRIAALWAIAIVLMTGACSSTPPQSERTSAKSATGAVETYPMHGKIVSLDPAAKTARIDAGPIGDWMGAMTMNYTIKDDAGFSKLAVGSSIDATVFVDGDNFWVGDIKPAQ